MAALLTLDEAKRHLRITFDDDDADLQLKILQASAIVLDYIKKRDSEWGPDTVPYPVQAAAAMVLSRLYDDRSAGVETNEVALGYLTPAATAILHRFRDPAIA